MAVGGSPVQIGAGRFGAGTGVIVTSRDGIDWFQQPPFKSTGTLLSVAFGIDRYVAVAKTNIVTWPVLTNSPLSPFFLNPYGAAVTYGNDMFVAVFGSSAYISTNGATWKFIGGPFEFSL